MVVASPNIGVDGHIYVLHGATGVRPATVHDFDGDGVAEFAVSSGNNYTTYRGDATILWQTPVSDSRPARGRLRASAAPAGGSCRQGPPSGRHRRRSRRAAPRIAAA